MTDVFDSLLNATCDVLEYGQGTADDYGQPDQTLTKLVTAVKCRPSMLKGGREWEAGKRFAENDWVIFLRPITVDDRGRSFALNAVHWLRVYCADGKVLLLNLKAVNDPSGVGHHLEARGTEIITGPDVGS